MSNFWDDDTVSEYDMMAEEVEKAEEIAAQIEEDPSYDDHYEEEYDDDYEEGGYDEDLVEESTFDLDVRETNVVHKARLRLEQAKLYEMFLNSDLFDDVDVAENAVKVVENELKEFIVERLEVLLGIRAEKERKRPIKQVVVESPFNDVETDFLKQLAAKGTAGKSLQGNTSNIGSLKKVSKPKTSGLKPISSEKRQEKTTPPPQKEVVKKAKPTPEPSKGRPLRKSSSKPKAKVSAKDKPKTKKQTSHSSLNNKPSEGVARKTKKMGGQIANQLTQEEVERIAKSDSEELARRKKPFHLLTADEKIQRIRETNERTAKKRPKQQNLISQEQANAIYQAKAQGQSLNNSGRSELNNLVANYIINNKG